MIAQANQIEEIQISQIENEVEHVQSKKTIKKGKEKQNEKEKRKERSRTPMHQDSKEGLTGEFDAHNKWHKEEGTQVTKRKRIAYENE